LQPTGPSEAARAIRKKLKYGNLHRQLRALTLLDGLIQNAGSHFQRTFADEALLERLRFCGTASLSDPEVRKKCTELFASWAAEYKKTPGMGQVANLYKVNRLVRMSLDVFELTVSSNFRGASKSSLRRSPRLSGRQRTRSARRMRKKTSPVRPDHLPAVIPEQPPSPTQ
jgi:hypothetical protein